MQFSFGKFTIAAQPFHFSMGFAVSPVFLQLRKGERQSGYSCVSFATYSQFTDTLLLHIRVLSAGATQGELPVRAREGALGCDLSAHRL